MVAVGVHHAAALVPDRASPFVEGKLGQTHAPVAHAAKDEAAVERLMVAGRHRDQAAVLFLEPVAYELDRFDTVVPVNRDGRGKKAKPYGHALARGLARRKALQDLHVALGIRVVLERRFAPRIELELGGTDDDIGA